MDIEQREANLASYNLDEPFIKESYRQTGIDWECWARDLATTNADQETKNTK